MAKESVITRNLWCDVYITELRHGARPVVAQGAADEAVDRYCQSFTETLSRLWQYGGTSTDKMEYPNL